jgi:hypothetical protein
MSSRNSGLLAGLSGATFVSCVRQTEVSLRRKFAASRSVLSQLTRTGNPGPGAAGTALPTIDDDNNMFQTNELGTNAVGVHE